MYNYIYITFVKIWMLFRYMVFRARNKELFENELIVIPDNSMYCGIHQADGTCKVCPFLTKTRLLPYQMNGYCYWLNMVDAEQDGLGLLWDGCKSCGINDYEPDE